MITEYCVRSSCPPASAPPARHQPVAFRSIIMTASVVGFGTATGGRLARELNSSARGEDGEESPAPFPADEPVGLLDSVRGIKQVVSAKTHSLALTETGEVWGFGGARYGLLGQVDEEKQQWDPDDEDEVRCTGALPIASHGQ